MTKIPIEEWDKEIARLCSVGSTYDVITCDGSYPGVCWSEIFVRIGLPLILERLEEREEVGYRWIYPGSLDRMIEVYGDLIGSRKDQIKRFMKEGKTEIYLLESHLLKKDQEFILLDGPHAPIVENKDLPGVTIWLGTFFAGRRLLTTFEIYAAQSQRVTPEGLEHALSGHIPMIESGHS